MQMFLTKLIIR